VESGYRIREIAKLDCEELERRLAARVDEAADDDGPGRFDALFEAIERLDAQTLSRLLAAERDARGAVAFARDFVLPFAYEIGSRWEAGALAIPAEHLATTVMRSMLIEALDRGEVDAGGPPIVFATPAGERHDLGLLVAALIAQQASARPIFVGADVPDEELVGCVQKTRAECLALGFVTSSQDDVVAVLRRLRSALPEGVELWAGGSGIRGCAPVRGVGRIENFDQLAACVCRLTPGSARAVGSDEQASSRLDSSLPTSGPR
jgi:methanogenic corrinoid protein MtbC1